MNANMGYRFFCIVVASHVWRARAKRVPVLLLPALGHGMASVNHLTGRLPIKKLGLSEGTHTNANADGSQCDYLQYW